MKTSIATAHRRQKFSCRSANAFSLVEVCIAVAIAAMGFVTLLGLLPQGINMARNSAQLSVGSRIIQKITGDMESMDWNRIKWTGYGPLRYFTTEGREMTIADTPQDQLAASLAYVASVYVPPQKPLDVVLPSGSGGGNANQTEPYLRRVKICVTSTTSPTFDFNSASPLRVSYAYAYIAQMGGSVN